MQNVQPANAPTYRSHGRMGLLGEEDPRLFQRQRLGLREGIARFYDLVPDLRHRRQIVLLVRPGNLQG